MILAFIWVTALPAATARRTKPRRAASRSGVSPLPANSLRSIEFECGSLPLKLERFQLSFESHKPEQVPSLLEEVAPVYEELYQFGQACRLVPAKVQGLNLLVREMASQLLDEQDKLPEQCNDLQESATSLSTAFNVRKSAQVSSLLQQMEPLMKDLNKFAVACQLTNLQISVQGWQVSLLNERLQEKEMQISSLHELLRGSETQILLQTKEVS